MITAVDANILVDLGVEDTERARKAAQAVEECGSAGPLIVCEVALAEFACGFPEDRDPMQADRLLTRDRGFYRDYFEGLQLLEPA